MTTNKSSADMPRAYNPAAVEQRLYQYWLDQGYFAAKPQPGKEPFTVIMPPPNVTGELHLGHALEKAIEDALVRWRRMSGDPTLWLPGTDHAGIATQWAVEQRLAAEGKDRRQLGRERFEELVWEHVREYGGIIHRQSQRLGVSADWDRLRFTLDPGPSRAVRTTFVNLYNKGLIYRHERIINWCPRCSTALSDLEVDYREREGALYHIRYPLEDESPAAGASQEREERYITVATVRPETMLGDTGIAVHPEDARYLPLQGRRAVLPIMGRSIPIVADTAVSLEFGTGALKVTPGHDPADFDIGQRHKLEIVTVIGPDGNMTEAAGEFAGMDRFQARQEVAARLESLGLLERVEEYRSSVGHCQRCAAVVEPLVSLQWFVNLGSHAQPDSIAGKAYAAVANGDIRIVPERFTRVYLNWLENIRDWCISRQLWWGHRIPVWYCDDCEALTVSVEDPAECASCGSPKLRQDPDALDTWFSSGLWPHSTLGWPDDTEDLRYFYPTSVLETGYDILFFWVARMIMLGIENTGKPPFRTVFLHGMIRDGTGAKMSKTRGNTMDPLELVEKYGTDALRFALTTGAAPGSDIRFTEGRLEAARNFANKVWNAARFVLTAIEGQGGPDCLNGPDAGEHRQDRWILSRMHRTTQEVNDALAGFELGEAQQKLYDFIWDDYCDWYIEMAKLRFRSGSGPSPLPVLVHVLERTLRLLHPFMPFITEEIWQHLRSALPQSQSSEEGLSESIMVASYPQADAACLDTQAEEEISLVMRAVRAIRNARAQLRIPSSQPLEALVEANGWQQTIEEEADALRALSRVEPLRILAGDIPQPGAARGISLVVSPLVVRLPLEGVVDLEAGAERLRNDRNECLRNLDRVSALVSNENFRGKAKPEVVEREEERLRSLQERRQRLDEVLEQLGHAG